MNIKTTPFTNQSMRPFGKLVELPPKFKATFTGISFNYWKRLGVLRGIEDMEIGLLIVTLTAMQFDQVERHALTPELLIPISGSFTLPVAPPSLMVPDVSDISAFRVRVGTSVLLNPNCWHGMPCCTSGESTILIIFKDNTSQNDLIVERLSTTCFLEENKN